jgi:hypothetical protein
VVSTRIRSIETKERLGSKNANTKLHSRKRG